MTTAPAESQCCAACAAANSAAAGRCWLCHEPLAGVSLAEPTFAREPALEWELGWGTTLWLVLLMVLVLVCFGLAPQAPGLAVGLAILATPVMLRTLVIMLR